MQVKTSVVATVAGLSAGLVLAGCGSSNGSSGGPAKTPKPVAQAQSSPAAVTPPITAANDHTITVVGRGSVTAAPDVATVTLGVTMTGASSADAVSAARAASDKLAATLVSSGVSRDDIATTQYSVGQHWNQQTQRNDGWETRVGLTAEVHDVNRVGTVISNAAAALPNVFWVGGVQLERDSTADILGAARDEAMKDAAARAAGWAQLAGVQLGDIVSVSEESATPEYVPPYGGQGAGGGGYETGTGQLSVTVTVVYAVK